MVQSFSGIDIKKKTKVFFFLFVKSGKKKKNIKRPHYKKKIK